MAGYKADWRTEDIDAYLRKRARARRTDRRISNKTDVVRIAASFGIGQDDVRAKLSQHGFTLAPSSSGCTEFWYPPIGVCEFD